MEDQNTLIKRTHLILLQSLVQQLLNGNRPLESYYRSIAIHVDLEML